MRVFVSWSGERSREVAKAFRDWLPLVLHYAEPWVSDADIEAGERWAQSVAGELAASTFGVVCVTSENVNSPWVLFEAGALAKSLESSKVIPLLLDLDFSDISGPLAQFQAKKLNRAGVLEVVLSIQASSDQQIPEQRARQLFEALWPDLEQRIGDIPDRAPTERHVRPQNEILEELVASVRSVDARVRESEEVIASLQRGRRTGRPVRMSPGMVVELRHFVGDGPDDPVGILVLASLVKDDLPWIYELAVDAYRELNERKRPGNRALRRLMRALEAGMRGPLLEEFGLDPRMAEVVFHEMHRYVDRLGSAGVAGDSDGPEDRFR